MHKILLLSCYNEQFQIYYEANCFQVYNPNHHIINEWIYTADEIMERYGKFLTNCCSVTILYIETKREKYKTNSVMLPFVHKFFTSVQSSKIQKELIHMINMMKHINTYLLLYCCLYKKKWLDI